MVLMALATIRAETASFEPIAEGVSHWNTSGKSHDFDLYDGRHDIGNGPAPDGAMFRGRGYVQITGRTNYTFYGALVGMPLAANPSLACDPATAAELLAAFLKAHEAKIRSALDANDLTTARRLVNGGTHGLAQFTDAYRRGVMAIPA
jgi:peptidoglycan L-alanyl-D-glutamate endopeptidase CwlK